MRGGWPRWRVKPKGQIRTCGHLESVEMVANRLERSQSSKWFYSAGCQGPSARLARPVRYRGLAANSGPERDGRAREKAFTVRKSNTLVDHPCYRRSGFISIPIARQSDSSYSQASLEELTNLRSARIDAKPVSFLRARHRPNRQ